MCVCLVCVCVIVGRGSVRVLQAFRSVQLLTSVHFRSNLTAICGISLSMIHFLLTSDPQPDSTVT